MTNMNRKGLGLRKKGFGRRPQGMMGISQGEAENSNTGNLDSLDKIGCAVGHLLG